MDSRIRIIAALSVVALVIVLANVNGTITGMQALPAPPSIPSMGGSEELPPSPPAPGGGSSAVCGNNVKEGSEECEVDSHCGSGKYCNKSLCKCRTSSSSSGSSSSPPTQTPSSSQDWQTLADQLLAIEIKVDSASQTASQVSGMDSRLRQLEVLVENLQQSPDQQQALFNDLLSKINAIQASAKRSAFISITLTVIALLMVSGLVAALIVQKRQAYIEDKKLLADYLLNYEQAGYRLETLKMHLQASGWSDKFIDEVIQELPGQAL